MDKRFHIHTFGCQMNVLDSEKAAGLLVAHGWSRAAAPEEADFILFNTCSVREKAAQKVYAYLGRALALRRRRPELVVGVMGCVAQQEGERLLAAVKGLNLVVGTHQIHRLPYQLDRILAGEADRLVDSGMGEGPLPVEIDTVLRETSFRAFVTIMEGCDNFCAYCVVPYVRGRERSRPSERILDEVRRLVAGGAVEVMLLGQNVNSYRDPSPAGLDFADLLAEVAAIPGLRRLRFTTSHPKDFNRRILQVFNEHPTICNQLHLPAQAGATRVLQAMNRRYTREEYLEKIGWIHASPRRISLSSDFIVGFPGETEEDFQETLRLLEAVRYDSIFSFVYSPRPGTQAAGTEDDIPDAVKKERLQRLQALQAEIQLANNRAEIGSVQEVLVDGAGREPGQLSSRTTENKIVHFDGDPALIGTFAAVRLTAASAHTLRGARVSES
jgi:tRNA-2-methylthio-N6-dimethylallyladenosine synthase